jgi:cytochrome d ubiquinol oxidase subunit II
MEIVVFSFLALSIFAYGLTAGADFGVGIIEILLPKTEREKAQKLGERSLAPIWEANQIWIIIVLVICFVGYPSIYAYLSTYLHVPLLIMLVGVILRGTAFTFRYYDVAENNTDSEIWSHVFRLGSIMTPFALGVIGSSLRTGALPATSSTVWGNYFAPWLLPLPLFAGLFAVTICSWSAAVFLLGECDQVEHTLWVARAKRATIGMITVGAATSAMSLLESSGGVLLAMRSPLVIAAVVIASMSVITLWSLLESGRFWLMRCLVGATFGAVLFGYFGYDMDTAIILNDGSRILWSEASAPEASLRALSFALIGGSMLILPGLAWLYHLFKQPTVLR